ncbi:NADH-dependent alcohol dehydrogenase [Maribacter sp. 6B07]|uniref:iron-containing alcohol dehydrogenase n=1 Tax=Maribacter TaxID=252356 RepID=UPI000C07C310|nr:MULTISPECIES: iron-containing alcohol dehydrogenase [Maribacter]MBU2902682.1 iron-containing alcohol dehydrogenase [Maribacter dokdonensis]MDP2524507.1 iron-containing alcohol dehydrogenase [Maribacter dokdonensis]PHN92272.1 NADH-dependent alcohol dehydrogenase [Maribacter sp. 6B07]CAG2532606.1 NADP-dependent alcohol dehydrogenase [Maribacter dokdonensis]|tara:strand:+ start:1397 stop:2554 length:1158 start_codon:yes stop_codon:yes gene_type:complete
MNNFEFKNPTKIIFGKDTIKKIESEIPANAKVLMLYGGGSIKKNGIYDQVTKALSNFDVIEFGGIPANPEYDTLMKALKVIKDENISYLLAVGGGSVIDGTKFLSAAAVYEGDTPWDILTKNVRTQKGMPFGTVLTLPATGSEMNSGAVITRAETKEKLAMGGPGLFPEFSVLDPQVITSIPERQLVNGITDAFTHVLEQYMTYPIEASLQDRFAESIMQTLIEVAPKVIKDPTDYKPAADFMWSCTMALNGLIQKGVPGDWAVHMMGHELTALFGIDHARTLAIVAPSHYKYNFEAKKEKLAQYGERVWNITEGSVDDKAYAAIEKTEAFFQELGIDTKLSDYTKEYEGTAEEIAKRFTDRGWKLGERQALMPEDAEKIVKMAY